MGMWLLWDQQGERARRSPRGGPVGWPVGASMAQRSWKVMERDPQVRSVVTVLGSVGGR